MARKTTEQREALRTRLIDIAETLIAEGGIDTIKARTLADAAGCSLGAIYNVFDDLRDLVIAVNGRTFRRLGESIASAPSGGTPTDRLIALSHDYLAFAEANPMTWRTLFDLEMSTDQEVPDWYLAELAKLFAAISAPLSETLPDLNDTQLQMMTRTLFSSVHGIVLLGLERRISGVPSDQLREMIALLLRNVTSHPKF